MADNVIEFLIKGDASGASKAFGSFDDVLGKFGKSLSLLGAAMAAVEFAQFIGRQIEVADQMGKMAFMAGTTVEEFSQLSYAFGLSDASAEELSGSFKFLNKAIDEAKQGNQSAIISFESIGISMANLKEDSPTEVMLKLADAFTQIEDPSARAALLLEKFGRAGLKLAPALEDGRAGIEKLMQQADELGLTVDKEFAAQADRFGDNLQRIGSAADGVGRQIGNALLPVLNSTLELLFDMGTKGTTSVEKWGSVMALTLGAQGALMLAFHKSIQRLTGGIEEIGAAQDAASTKPKIEPISKEAAARMETTRKALTAFIADMEKAELTASGNKLALMDAEYNRQVGLLNELGLTKEQRVAADAALDANYAAQRVQLHDTMLGQLGIADEEYRTRTAELLQQDADRMAQAGMSQLQVDKFIKTSLLEQQLAYLEAKNAAISEDYLTQDEITLARDEMERVRIETAYANNLISKEAYDAAIIQAEITKQAKLGSIHAGAELARLQVSKMTFGQQLAYTTQSLDSISALTQSKSKEGFRLGKAAALAQAVISTYTSATNAYMSASAIPFVGWILGPIAAAAALALGMQNVSAIRSQQMGQAHAGMTNIPAEGTYLLDKGERVIQPEQNKDLTNFLKGGEEGGGGGGVQIGTLSIEITVPNGEGLRNMTRREWEDIVSDRVIPALNVLDRKGVRPDSVQRYSR